MKFCIMFYYILDYYRDKKKTKINLHYKKTLLILPKQKHPKSRVLSTLLPAHVFISIL